MSNDPDLLTQCMNEPKWAADTIATQRVRIHELESQIHKDSRNSSKPPSSDGFKKPAPKSQRRKAGKSHGGQKGHRGHTLQQIAEPDEVVTHEVSVCHACGYSLDGISSAHDERRQVFDIPPVAMHVTEHQGQVCVCPACRTKNRALFPKQVNAPVQYGLRLKAWIVYFHQYQLLPYERVCELMADLLGQPVSRATLVEAERRFFDKVKPAEDKIVTQILSEPVAHFDETGIGVEGKTQWLHVASTDTLTHYHVHLKRGQIGIEAGGVLPNYMGVAVHDAWKPYFKFEESSHALCHAHHLRELTGIYEQEGQQWAKDMGDLLIEMKETVESERILDLATLFDFEQRYDQLIEDGIEEDERLHPMPAKPKGKRGRTKQSPAKNLLDRLQTYRSEALGFIRDPCIPFDNNQAERDVRMAKVQQKISGTFRDASGAERFCRIRGYISTMKKQSQSVLGAIHSVLKGNPILPGKGQG